LCLLVVFLYFLVVWFFVMFDFCLLFIIVIIFKAHEIQIKAKVEKRKRKRKIYDMFISLFLFYVYWKKKIVCLFVGVLVPQNFLKNHALSLWEEIKLNKKIQALVSLSKMRSSPLEYACKVTFLINKDGSKRFCDNYRPLNFKQRETFSPCHWWMMF